MLAAIFNNKGMLHLETFLEMNKEEFIHLLLDSAILVEASQDDEKGGEIKKKFNPQSVMGAIASVGTFDNT